jgi:DNA-binding response OmpR family regulator
MSEAPRLLVVEDEENLAAGLKLNFELEGYRVDLAGTAREAGNLLLGESYDAIVLDVMLPDLDGFKLCQKLRDSGNVTPVLMLTARGGVDDRVEGLNVGADDYLTKPFELTELLARVRSLLRRRTWERETTDDAPVVLRLGRGVVDFEKLRAEIDGEVAHLTKLEFDLLRYFAANPDRVLSREELQREVWKLQDYPNRRMVDNFIMRLRRHFEPDPAEPKFFVSVRGAGYKFVPPAVA